jgi:hypothetical protein
MCLCHACCAAEEQGGSISLAVPGGGLSVTLSGDGRLVGATVGAKAVPQPITAETVLAGCQREGQVELQRSEGGGVQFTKHLLHAADGRRCVLIERLRPTASSIRWEIAIRGQGQPWSTAIETRLQYPVTRSTRFWTAWSDSGLAVPGGTYQGTGAVYTGDFGATMPIHYSGWTDPLCAMPLRNTKFYYGAAYYGPAHPDLCITPSRTDLFCIPLATFVEPSDDTGLTVALSPDDKLPELTMTTDEEGALVFSRIYHRISESRPACFALDLVAHEGDWRGAMRWMVGRYPEHFDPPLPRADRMAGCAAYSADQRHFDTSRLHQMAFRSNWKCSEDFPYQGMFLPIDDDHTQWTRWLREPPVEGKGPKVSCGMMNDYGRWMHSQGFYVLNYFDVAEFGNYPVWPAPPRKAARDEDLWKDSNDFLYGRLRSALLMRKGHPIGEQTFVLDPGDPAYETFLLEQAQRHLRRLPDTDGLAIDRMDLIHTYNTGADDGVTWYDGKPARALCLSWQQLMSRLGPMMHRADKAIFVNNHTKRLDLLREVDGIYCEFGYLGTSLNTSALLCVRKPLLLWTDGPAALEPDPDAYFQRHLYLGGYPTAPYPGNNHCIKPGNARAEQFYLDYGPLLDAMRGKKWVLLPRVVEVTGEKARANLFATPGGYVVPIVFGGKEKSVELVLSGLPRLPGQNGFRIELIHPGEEQWTTLSEPSGYLTNDPLEAIAKGGTIGQVRLRVPLARGCAMVKLAYAWIDPKVTWFDSTAEVSMGTTIAGGEIRYTLDGPEPDANSAGGGSAVQFPLDKTATVRAAVFVAGRRAGDVVTSEFVRLPPATTTP